LSRKIRATLQVEGESRAPVCFGASENSDLCAIGSSAGRATFCEPLAAAVSPNERTPYPPDWPSATRKPRLKLRPRRVTNCRDDARVLRADSLQLPPRATPMSASHADARWTRRPGSVGRSSIKRIGNIQPPRSIKHLPAPRNDRTACFVQGRTAASVSSRRQCCHRCRGSG
jgi:hypothetical protein